LDFSGIGGLAYQIFVDLQKRRDDATSEQDQIGRFTRAIVLELRVLLNLLDLADRANEAGDENSRNAILRQMTCPLLSAVGMGLNDVPLSRDGAQAIVASLAEKKLPNDDSAENENPDVPERDAIDRISLMVSRLLTVQAMANVGTISIEIQWDRRLSRLRGEMVGVLRTILDSATAPEKTRGIK
jgi:hypothetical protein